MYRVCLAVERDLIFAGHPEQQLFQAVPLNVLSDHVDVAEHRVNLVERAHGRVGDDVDDERADEFVVVDALHLLDSNELRLLAPIHILQVARFNHLVGVQKAVFRLQAVHGGVNQVYILVGEKGSGTLACRADLLEDTLLSQDTLADPEGNTPFPHFFRTDIQFLGYLIC